ncbi:MAG: nitroreductase family protein [Anaerolineae bacterium]|nr:nitroreductase family protein [Anaerolineae bacterium]
MEPLTVPDLFARRSIRRFDARPVTQAQVERLLQAAMSAPSAGDRKPWHFVVVRDAELRRRLAALHPYAKMLPQAPVCIVPCGEPERGFPGKTEFWIQDVSAATENLLLAAVGLGLGAVWCGVYPVMERVEATRQVLGLPETIVPLCFVPVGYPAEAKPPRTQYDPSRVHTDGW